MNQTKIAFIYYPREPNSVRLDTMPFALNSVIALAKIGWNIDLYLWEDPSLNYQGLLPKNITIKYFVEPPKNQFSLLLWYLQLQFPFKWQNNYLCVFGVSQIGHYVAHTIASHNRAPLVYFNDELPSHLGSDWENNRLTKLEKQIIHKAAMIVLPDSQRFQPLCQELKISHSIPHAELPNIAITTNSIDSIDWHKRLGIPDSCIPFLHAGSIGDWAQVPELLSSVPYWPKEAVLILHSRSSERVEAYRKQLSHLEIAGRVFWSLEPMSESILNSLVSYCAGNFALYRNSGPNIEYLGLSSGKLLRSLASGSPVIASDLASLSFVSEYQLGVLVSHPAEITKAIEKIIRDREFYSNNCLQFCKNNLSFEMAWETLCLKFKEVTNIDLYQPIP